MEKIMSFVIFDTEFIADITYNYDVVFMVDNNIYNSQIVVENGYATLPNNPSKSGYDFDGWTLNGVNVIEPNNTKITNNTTFISKRDLWYRSSKRKSNIKEKRNKLHF